MGKKLTAIVYSKEDAKIFGTEKPNVSSVYPMTPDAYAELIHSSKVKIIETHEYLTDYTHRKIIAKVRRAEREIHSVIDKNSFLSIAEKEQFISLFHVLASSCYYIFFSIRYLGPWLIYNGAKWVKTSDLAKAYQILSEYIFTQHHPTYFNIVINTNDKHSKLVNHINNFTFSILNKFNCIWTTGTEYGLRDLNKLILEADSNTVIFYLRSAASKAKLIRSIKNLFFAINPYKKFKEFGIIPITSSVIPTNTEKIFKAISDKNLKLIIPIIRNYINKSLRYIQSIDSYTNEIFIKSNPKILISHQLKFSESLVLGVVAKKNNIHSILISHGSHPMPQNITAGYELFANARNMIFSDLSSESVVQSPSAENYLKEFLPNTNFRKSKPIMWGRKNININNRKRDRKLVLHAGTSKALGTRPWIYETPSEYVKGLQQLLRAFNEMNDVTLVIRARASAECSLKTLKKLLPRSKNYIIKTGGNFFNDLAKADLLISFSSTTIEEALYARKPVALFGGTDRFKYLPGTSKCPDTSQRGAVYHLKNHNMVQMLKAILQAHSKNPLTDTELKNYIWLDNIADRENLVSQITNKRFVSK